MMNPLILRVGATVVIGAVILLAKWLVQRNGEQSSSYSNMSYGNFDGCNKNTCYICLTDFTEKNFLSLPCKHKFHRHCISLAFKEVSSLRTCPVCRREIPDSFASQVLFM